MSKSRGKGRGRGKPSEPRVIDGRDPSNWGASIPDLPAHDGTEAKRDAKGRIVSAWRSNVANRLFSYKAIGSEQVAAFQGLCEAWAGWKGLDRLEAAGEGSEKLSADVLAACFPRKPFIYSDVTESLDAALALAERVLGKGIDWAIYLNWAIRTDEPDLDGGGWEATDTTVRGCWVRVFGGPYALRNVTGEARTPALALCAAILRASQTATTTAEPE